MWYHYIMHWPGWWRSELWWGDSRATTEYFTIPALPSWITIVLYTKWQNTASFRAQLMQHIIQLLVRKKYTTLHSSLRATSFAQASIASTSKVRWTLHFTALYHVLLHLWLLQHWHDVTVFLVNNYSTVSDERSLLQRPPAPASRLTNTSSLSLPPSLARATALKEL